LLYGGASAISRAFALITFPLLSRHFSEAEYGQLDFFMVLANLLALAVIFGQDSAVGRFFFEDEDPEQRRSVVSQSLILQFGFCLLLVPLLWLATDSVSPWLVKHEQRELFYKLVLLQLPFIVAINFSVNLLKYSFARVPFIVMSLGSTAVQAAALVIGIKYFDAGIREILLIGLGVSIFFGGLGLYLIRHWLAWPGKLNKVREMILFAIPFGMICVMSAFSPTLERSLTESLLGGPSLGHYAVGVKIAMLMGLLISAFQTAWAPFSLSLFKQSDAAETFNWVLKVFALGSCAMAFVLAITSSFLIQFLSSDRYAAANVVVFPLAIGLAIQGTSWITEIGISISRKSYLGLYGYLCMIGITLLLISWLTPLLGLFGVALGVLGGHICKAIVASWLAQRAFPLAWSYRPVVALYCFSLIVGLSGSVIAAQYPGHWPSLIYIAGLVLLLLMGTWVLFSAADRAKMKQLVLARLRRPGIA
jgi:O-antigen/teichoic acid export membrane protein